MAKGFFQVTPHGSIDLETIENVFWYAVELGLETSPSSQQMSDMAGAWDAGVRASYVAALPDSYGLTHITVRAWQVDGTPSEELPVTQNSVHAGGQSGDKDGNAHVAHLRFGMGVLVAFSGTAGALRRSHLAIGPLLSDAVGDQGQFDPAAWGTGIASALSGAVDNELDMGGGFTALPVRVSLVDDHVATPNIMSYRSVTSAFYGSQTGLLRGRTNSR